MNIGDYPKKWKLELYIYTALYCTSNGRYSIQRYVDESEYSESQGRKWLNLKAVHMLITKTMMCEERANHFFASFSQEMQSRMISASYEMTRNMFNRKQYAKRKGVSVQEIGLLNLTPEMRWLNNNLNKIRRNYMLLRPAILGVIISE